MEEEEEGVQQNQLDRMFELNHSAEYETIPRRGRVKPQLDRIETREQRLFELVGEKQA